MRLATVTLQYHKDVIMKYIYKLFAQPELVASSAVLSIILTFLFPTTQMLFSALAVLGMFALDLITKLFAKSYEAGGWRKAFKTRAISSMALFKGTRDKLIIFAVFTLAGGLLNQIAVLPDIGTWFTSGTYLLMIIRDLLSVMENLTDAGVKGLEPFKKFAKKKADENGIDIEDNGGDNK